MLPNAAVELDSLIGHTRKAADKQREEFLVAPFQE